MKNDDEINESSISDLIHYAEDENVIHLTMNPKQMMNWMMK